MPRRSVMGFGAAALSTAMLTGRTGLAAEPVRAALSPATPVTGTVTGWIVVGTGSAMMHLSESEGAARRPLASKHLPVASIADTARLARLAAISVVAATWKVPSSECACDGISVVHRRSGREVPLRMWMDFA